MKPYLLLCFLFVGLRVYSQAVGGSYPYPRPYPINGVTPNTQLRIFGGPGVTSGYNDNYPVVWDVFTGGGYRSVGTTTERDQILSGRRKEGMVVYVTATATAYRLTSDLATWTDLTAQTAALYEPLDTDLIRIASLAPATGDFLQQQSGGWTNRTIAQMKADLSLSGVNTGDQTIISGNAGTATTLQTARTINLVSFNGSADIVVTSASGTLTGGTLVSSVTNSSLISFGSSPVLVTPALGVASATSLAITGTGGNGFESYVSQTSTPATPVSGFVEFADATGRKSWKRASDGFIRTWDATLTADRVFGLPDVSGMVALASGTTFTNVAFTKTITASGTTGAQTINKQMGRVNFAAAATTLVVTDSLVTINSVIELTMGTADATAARLSAVPSAGSFTITFGVAPTAETAVYFLVLN